MTKRKPQIITKTGVPYAEWAINPIQGCYHGCRYPCYAFKIAKRFKRFKHIYDWSSNVTYRWENTIDMLRDELERKKKRKALPKDVYLCFSTDPFPYWEDWDTDGPKRMIAFLSEMIMEELTRFDVHVTVLTKGRLPTPSYLEFGGLLLGHGHDWGISLVSTSSEFQKKWEPGASPPDQRVAMLKALHDCGERTWVSMEPLPPPEIHEVDMRNLLHTVEFVDHIVIGRWNYHRFERDWSGWYKEQVETARVFCEHRGIGLKVKDIFDEDLTVICQEVGHVPEPQTSLAEFGG